MRVCNIEDEGTNKIKQAEFCFANVPVALRRLRIHRRSSLAGMVFRSINWNTASAGMRTARPQFTRGSFRRSSQARIVAGFTAKTSLASLTLNNFCISLASGRNDVLPDAGKSVVFRWCSGGIPVVFRTGDLLGGLTFLGQAQ